MNKLLPICLALVFSGCKCKKDNPAPATPASYMPITAGSSWTYSTQTYAPVASTGSYTIKATARDTIVSGRTYKVFTNSSTDNEYYNITGTDYFQLGNLAAINQRLELLYLKDAAVGTSWTENKTVTLTGIPTPVTIPLNFQVTEAGISYTVGAKTFTGVTHVKITIGTISVSGIPITPVSDFNYYYARGVGRIYARTKLSISIPLAGININNDDELKLTSYTIL
ncbi:MAG: hypothetical protein ABIX01_16275 [Chitinophagaceae bacterium]